MGKDLNGVVRDVIEGMGDDQKGEKAMESNRRWGEIVIMMVLGPANSAWTRCR